MNASTTSQPPRTIPRHPDAAKHAPRTDSADHALPAPPRAPPQPTCPTAHQPHAQPSPRARAPHLPLRHDSQYPASAAPARRRTPAPQARADPSPPRPSLMDAHFPTDPQPRCTRTSASGRYRRRRPSPPRGPPSAGREGGARTRRG